MFALQAVTNICRNFKQKKFKSNRIKDTQVYLIGLNLDYILWPYIKHSLDSQLALFLLVTHGWNLTTRN